MSDMQEMAHIVSIFKSLYLRNPSQIEISSILKERKLAREIKPAEEIQLKQLF